MEDCEHNECIHWNENQPYNCVHTVPSDCKLKDYLDEEKVSHYAVTVENLKLKADLALHKRALDILGKKVIGCPKIEKANSCNEWASGRACPKCRIDAAINEAKEKVTP